MSGIILDTSAEIEKASAPPFRTLYPISYTLDPTMPVITFQPTGLTVSVDGGTTVLDAAVQAGLAVHAPCGGIGRCGKCEVQMQCGVAEPTPGGAAALSSAEEIAAGIAAGLPGGRIVDDCRVTLPESFLLGEASHCLRGRGAGDRGRAERGEDLAAAHAAECGRSSLRSRPRARRAASDHVTPGPRRGFAAPVCRGPFAARSIT